MEVLGWIVLPLLPMCMLASVLSLVMRYRHSRGEERQQLKWFAYAAALIGAIIAGHLLFLDALLSEALVNLLDTLTVTGLYVAVGIAILRYRLFDIDILINRTLVYGSLTVMLVLVYVGSVVGLQYLFRALTGQESQLAIVASTLAIAALFNPLRRRVQSVVDRLFYRRKYDAAKTLQAYSAKLRDETDLAALNGELLTVVRNTMQPVHVSVWLREPEDPR